MCLTIEVRLTWMLLGPLAVLSCALLNACWQQSLRAVLCMGRCVVHVACNAVKDL
jgi:hypothetical protein